MSIGPGMRSLARSPTGQAKMNGKIHKRDRFVELNVARCDLFEILNTKEMPHRERVETGVTLLLRILYEMSLYGRAEDAPLAGHRRFSPGTVGFWLALGYRWKAALRRRQFQNVSLTSRFQARVCQEPGFLSRSVFCKTSFG